MCVYNPYNFQNQIRITQGATKRQIDMGTVSFVLCIFCVTIRVGLVFWFLYIYFEFGSKNYRNCRHTCHERSHMIF
jgi:hypothetical protein